MNGRSETVEMAEMSGARSDSGTRACSLQHVKVTNRENARQRGNICGRSRSLMISQG